MRQKSSNGVKIAEQKNEKKHINVMAEINHFDQYAIKIAPSILENKVKKIWNPTNSFTRLGTVFIFAISILMVLSSAEFKKTLNILGETWKAFFLMLFIIASLFFIIDAFLLWLKRKNLVTAERFVGDLIKKDHQK